MKDFIPTDADSIRKALLNFAPFESAIIKVNNTLEGRIYNVTKTHLILKSVSVVKENGIFYSATEKILITDIKTMTISKAIN
jgi:transcription elongation factor